MPYVLSLIGLIYSLASIWAMGIEPQGTLMQWVYCIATLQGVVIFLAGMLLISAKGINHADY